jgi:selenide, water dikinase
VYAIGDGESGTALVQTVDFFTPIVDDPYLYGQIAAANSLSDVYAMGGTPLTALAIAGFPQDGLHTDDIAQIFRGGFDKLREAGVALLGGHTVQDREIKFGYSVTGTIDPKRILTNAGAKPGDRLILTKALGTGIVGTAIKFGRAPQAVIDAAVDQMRALNKVAAETVTAFSQARGGVHACTDITGFGLAGHASEMAAASNVTIEISANDLPLIPGVLELAAMNKSGGMTTNREHFLPGIEFLSPDAGVTGDGRVSGTAGRETDALRDLIFDPQTSGGLLIAVASSSADTLFTELKTAGISASFIGSVNRPHGPRLRIG